EESTQLVELAAVLQAFTHFCDTAINLVTDSTYVAGLLQCLDKGFLKEVDNKSLFTLLSNLSTALLSCKKPYFVVHLRSHTSLPDPIVEGNARAGRLTVTAIVLDIMQQAQLSHDFYLQNASALAKLFRLSLQEAPDIVTSCPSCQRLSSMSFCGGIVPRGIIPKQLWQTDVTHTKEFGHLSYVHASGHTASGLLSASAHTGEKTKDVIRHFLWAFATMGVPMQIRTDNGPTYMSTAFGSFLQLWGIIHTTGIPHSLRGQAIVGCALHTLNTMLEKQ
ncbi:hypothetical protein N331_11729, partial [Merops nubicus]